MKVALTGTTGFIGGSLLERFASESIDVIKIVRGVDKANERDFCYVKDIGPSTFYGLDKHKCEVVVHCAARVHVMNDSSADPQKEFKEVNTEGTLNLAREAIASGVKRFIFVSSVKVNGEITKINEPFKFSDDFKPMDFYAQSKADAEKQLFLLAQETGLEVVVIRPTLVYGPGVKANFAALMNLVSKGVPLPFGCIKNNRRSLVSVTNLVDLIVTCIDHPKAANQTFLVSDDYDVSTSEMVAQMAKALGKSSWQLPVPKWCYKCAGRVLRKQEVVDRLLGSLQVDIAHTKETLDWTPPQTLEQGFKHTAQVFLQSKQK
ncbi:UDP-glucose 4-epimerase family protein [Vibrio astriarenae]